MLLGAGDSEKQPVSGGSIQQIERGRRITDRITDALEEERPRWFYWVPVFLGAGGLFYFSLRVEPGIFSVLGALVAAVALRLVTIRWAGTFSDIATGIFLCLALGLFAAKVRTELVRAPVLSVDAGVVKVSGVVELVEERGERGQRLTIRPTRIETVFKERLPARVRISVRPGIEGLFPGDLVSLSAKLSPPPRASVPGGYDFARYAYFQKIGAVGYATSPPVKLEGKAQQVRAGDWSTGVLQAIAIVRKRIGDRVKEALPGQTGEIANALITGDRSGITEETNETYRASGLFHILSISGLHMAIMGGAVFFALRFTMALFPSIALNYSIKKWAAAGAIIGSFGYLLISGGTFATVRSFLMITVMFISILVDRPALALRNVALSALLILVLFPESVVDPGFQMSFAAVVGLVAAYEAVGRRAEQLLAGPRARWWRVIGFFGAIVGSTLVASAAVAPLGIYHFHQTQHYAVLANLIAVPICNLIVMPAALGALVLMPIGGEGLALAVMGPGLQAMGGVADWVAGLSGAVSRVPAIPEMSLAAMALGGLWLCLFRPIWRLYGLVFIGVGIILAPMKSAPDILIGDEGRLVVLRDGKGEFSGLTSRYSEYELTQWLARDGDRREAKEVSLGGVLNCDEAGCAGRAKNLIVAVARHPSSLRDDCHRADILVIARGAGQVLSGNGTGFKPVDGRKDALHGRSVMCAHPKLIITRETLRELGTHALRVDDVGGVEVETVADVLGSRPWSEAVVKAD